MDRAHNPYSPGAGTSPPALAGRSSILEQATIALKRVKNGLSEQSLILVGLRGVGKTVLLREIERMAEEESYHPILIEAHETRHKKSIAELLVPHLRKLLYDLNRGEQISRKTKRALRVLKSFVEGIKVKIAGVEINLDIDPEEGVADSGDLEVDLASLFVAIAEAARDRETAIALIIDELQYVSETDLSALIMAIHRVSQRSLPFLMVGAGLPQIVAKAGVSKSYAERLFAYPEIGALDRESADEAIQSPAEKLGLKFSKQALEEIYRVTKGYPYFLQEWGYQAWNIAEVSPVTLPVIQEATQQSIEKLDANFFRVRFDRLTPAEKEYVHALAKLGSTPQRSGDIAAKLNKSVEQVAPLRAKLINKGMIYSPAHGDTAFTVPLFEEFLARQMRDKQE